MVREFHERFGLAVNQEPDYELLQLRANLVTEEAEEVSDELYLGHLEAVAKELADLVYVAYGTAISLGIDLDAAIREVHKSNMSKMGSDGVPLKRSDGKILKGPNYEAPDVRDAVYGGYHRAMYGARPYAS